MRTESLEKSPTFRPGEGSEASSLQLLKVMQVSLSSIQPRHPGYKEEDSKHAVFITDRTIHCFCIQYTVQYTIEKVQQTFAIHRTDDVSVRMEQMLYCRGKCIVECMLRKL